MDSSDLIRLTTIAKELRKRPTKAENVLWQAIRNKRLFGLKFRRQQVLGSYIVDFVCLENRLVIEVDGGQHAVEKEKDLERDAWLGSQGFQVMRFWNNDVLGNMEGVLEAIGKKLNPPPPSPPARGGESTDDV